MRRVWVDLKAQGRSSWELVSSPLRKETGEDGGWKNSYLTVSIFPVEGRRQVTCRERGEGHVETWRKREMNCPRGDRRGSSSSRLNLWRCQASWLCECLSIPQPLERQRKQAWVFSERFDRRAIRQEGLKRQGGRRGFRRFRRW